MTIESKWQKIWADKQAWVPKDDGAKPRYYALSEFPYPSAAGFHAGHMMAFTGMDVLARFKRKSGFDVLFPMGFDSLGISAENYATKIGRHPAEVVPELVANFIREMNKMGWSFDPNSHIATSDPEFVKWTQWMFIRLFNAGLAYKSMLPMNWCPKCRTTLTNEELDDGNCNRCNGPVEVKEKMQWNLAMTRYADRLIDDLEGLDYPDRVKKDQINWIGKSVGIDIDFEITPPVAFGDTPPMGGNSPPVEGWREAPGRVTVYTTRADTIGGATSLVLAPEHKQVAAWLESGAVENADAVREYIAVAAAKDEFDRTNDDKEKTGVILDGITAINPITKREMPVYIADYVLVNYGTGAIMNVPAHDERDFAFAEKYGCEILPVIDDNGIVINSGPLNGLGKAAADAKVIEVMGARARAKTRYKMTDWGFSRQMYWGEPIPMVDCAICGWVPLPDSDLPLIAPHVEDYKPTEEGESPLARLTDWMNTTCPKCGGAAVRETDTMPQWAGSSWYYLRYLDPKNDAEFCSKEQMKNWMPVDHYNGGNEHNTRHLLYSRFWYKALFDMGLVPTNEPYKKRTTNGLLLGFDGKKMSKSKGNGFQLSDMIEKVGADVARLTSLSLGPWEDNVIWTDGALAGAERFLKRVAAFSDKLTDTETAEQKRLRNQLLKDVTERINAMQFNTAIAAQMEYINQFDQMPKDCYIALLHCLNPFAPHLTEEMFEKIGGADLMSLALLPTIDESALIKTDMVIVVSVNGKRRDEITVKTTESKDGIESLARAAVKKHIAGDIAKVIHVSGRMVNFVIGNR